MDKQKQIEEMAKVLCINDNFVCETCPSKSECFNYWHAKQLYNAGYRKIPEGAVVLTANEQVDRWIDLLVEFDEMGFEPTTLPPKDMSVEEYTAFYKARLLEFLANARKETAEKFAERLKETLENRSAIDGYDLEDLEFDGEIIQECIDEIAKEITEGE